MFNESQYRKITIVQEPTKCFLVTVGCAKIPVVDSKQLLKLLAAYLNDPRTVEKSYIEAQNKEENPQGVGYT